MASLKSFDSTKTYENNNASPFGNNKKASKMHPSDTFQRGITVIPPPRRRNGAATWAIVGIGLFFIGRASGIQAEVRTSQVHRRLQDATPSSDWIDELPTSVVTYINRDVDPCDDLYEFSCGAWLEQVKIPEDKTNVALAFTTVQDDNEVVLKEVMEQGWPLIGELYDSCMNYINTSDPTANEASVAILVPTLMQIAATTNKEELFQLAGNISRVGPSLFTAFFVDADARDATRYALHAFQQGLTLPTPQFYLNNQQFDLIKDDFHAYILTLFQLAGHEADAAASRAASVLSFEQQLAPLYVPIQQLQDPIATYNRKSIAETIKTYPLLFRAYLNGSGLLPDFLARNLNVIVQTPAFFDRAEALVSGGSVTLDTLQSVLAYRYLANIASLLSAPFVHASFAFRQKTLNGQATQEPRWKTCVARVTNAFPDLVGKYFARVRSGNATIELARAMVTQIQDTFQKNLMELDWLDEPTRKAAIDKLNNITNHIGHSTQDETFPFQFRRNASFVANLQLLSNYELEKYMGRIGTSIDRDEWSVSSAVVNAFYLPRANRIVLPDGILQVPFFAHDRHFASNFGSIGCIIGHELTHGFDSSGRQYAGDGNLRDWWSNVTTNEFLKRSEGFQTQYNRYEVRSQTGSNKVLGTMNGNLTLRENIADNGGVKIAFAAYQKYRTDNARQDVWSTMNQAERNMSITVADRLFFISFAQTFCSKRTDTIITNQLASGTHAIEQWRINGVASNMQEFANVFSCPLDSAMNPKTKHQLW
ncbi:hypothetical protein CCR75_005739 [Bremia lactucae]|uniref:Endothelin-converting enzyme 1 n=1 Tax=Bremia lactucae TaxID=4779 RepID=A0A976IG37_BRELC|nr:hypothetical protein CCR75_005739 [Bremia lactucae]